MNGINLETMELLKKSHQELRKAGITTGTGLVTYSLEAEAKLIYPILTPFRNIIPRTGAPAGSTGFGTAAHWKEITAINTTNIFAGVSEGRRNAVQSVSEVDRIATYAGFGMENSVSFEADYAGQGFEDVKALAVLQNLQSLMVQEEMSILNGNASNPIGQGNTPTVTPSATGGTIAAGSTNYVYVAPLTYRGFVAATNGTAQSINPVASNATLTPIQSRTNADGTTDTYGNGVGQISAASTVFTTTGSNSASFTATTSPSEGAFGYAWFFGTTSGAGNAQLVAITNLPNVTVTATSTATYPANSTGLSSDNSVNALEFNGLISTAINGSGYFKSLAGNTLTADGFGGIVEIDAALKSFWDNYRLTPTDIWVDSQTVRDIVKKIAAGSTNPAFRVNIENGVAGLGNLTGGNLVTTYLNKYALNGASSLNIRLHPNMPIGTIYFDMDKLPVGWGHAKVGTPRDMRVRKEYYQIEWPITTREYEYGVYVDEVLQVYVTFGTGVITDIAAG
jgi:hypothetical protein